ncbi:MAG: hypothetical protein KAI47_05750, partial [Deltaproteobacteria bacterium]|nr:hypothetical protein [Deltaproteobacteria bacterium]
GALASPFWLPPFIWLLLLVARRRQEVKETAVQPLPRLSERPTPTPTPPNLSNEQAILERPSPDPSIYGTLLALGASTESLKAWRRIAEDELTEELWVALVAGEHDALHTRLRERWLKRLARERVLAWINKEPLIAQEQLQVEIPDDLEVATVNELVMIGHDGLAVEPDGLQEAILTQARRGLTETYRGADNPFVLERVTRREKFPALLGTAPEAEDSNLRSSLAALLCGTSALDTLTAAGLINTRRGAHLRDHLQRHHDQKRGKIPDEGCAAHAILRLPGPEPEGIGALLASVAGAAYSPATVALEISRLLPSADGASLERFGRLAITALAAEDKPQKARIHAGFRALLGKDTLDRALPTARALEETIARDINHNPLWPKVKPGHSPILALVTLHRQRLEFALNQVDTAHARLTQVLAKVAYAGRTRRDQSIAAQRLGYALAGFAPTIFQALEGELAEAAAKAAASLYE